MLNRVSCLIVLAFVCALAACDVSGLVPKEDLAFAKRVVTMVKTQDAAGLQAVSDPALWAQLPDNIRAQMARIFPSEPESSATVSSWHSNYNNGFSQVEMVMLYKYAQRDVKVTIGFRSAGQRYTLMMIYVLPITGGVPAPMPGPAPSPMPAPYSGDGNRGTPMPQSQPGEMPPQSPDDDQSNDKSQSL